MGPFSANTVVSYHVSVEDRLGKIHNGETLTISVAEVPSTDTDDDTPGFEGVFLLAALTIALISIGKKRKKAQD